MLLVIDVGNTNIVYGLFEGEALAHQFRVESARGRTADEYAVILRQLLLMNSIAPEQVHAAIIASGSITTKFAIVPKATHAVGDRSP